MPAPRVTLIAAVARNGVIGADNALPWRLPEDLKHFKALTMGHPIIMGRRTFESLGRLLPGRSHIVITRDRAFAVAGCLAAGSVERAIELGAGCPGGDEMFVIGGAEIYRLALPLVQRLQLTEIHRDFPGDAHFPDFDRRDWRETARESHRAETGFNFDFVTYDRQH